MNSFLLFAFLIALCAGEVSVCSPGETFTREQVWTCAMNVVDTNKDGYLDGLEIDAAKQKYLYWYERALGYIAGPTQLSVVMHDCDADLDGRISHADYEAKKLYCMPYMDPKKNWRVESNALCLVKKFCDRAAQVLNKPVYN